ncbi:MAG TPA: hypothetical protein VK737_04460, partial [Opitutales bacterium]|nr:hypothetical protein [Opitutales bacterium]
MNFRAKILIGLLIVAVCAVIPILLQQQEISKLRADLAKSIAKAASAVATRKHGPLTALEKQTNADTLKHILSMPSEVDYLRNLLDFASTLDANGTRALLEDLAAQPLNSKNRTAIDVLIDRLVHLDPQSALDWANTVPNAHGRQQMLGMLFYTWSNVDPAKALDALGNFTNASLRQNLTQMVLNNMIVSNPKDAIATLQKLPPSTQGRYLYSSAFYNWAQADPVAATAAAMALPATRDRSYALS